MSALPSTVLTQNRTSPALLKTMSDLRHRLDPDGVRALLARGEPVSVRLTPVEDRWQLEIFSGPSQQPTRWIACMRVDGPPTFEDTDLVEMFVVNTGLPMPSEITDHWTQEDHADYARTLAMIAAREWDVDDDDDDDAIVPPEQVKADNEALHALILEEIAKRQR